MSVTVQNGDILVTGTGLNVTGVELLNLVARTIKIDGPVNGNDLRVYAGAATHTFASAGEQSVLSNTEITSTAPTNNPAALSNGTYAIDSSVLGGMYANAIRLVATDAGVGVRMLGEVASTAADFTLTAAGKVELGGKVSSKRDVAITSTVGGRAVELTNAAISAERNIQLTATQGDATIAGGQLFASNNLDISAQSLTDTKTNHPQVSNNERFAGNVLSVNTTGGTSLSETVWRAQEHLSIDAATLNLASQTQLGSDNTMSLVTSGDMSLGQGQIKAEGDLSLQATGEMSVSAGGGQGIQIQAQRASTVAVGTLNNSGKMVLSQQPLAQDTDSITVAGTLTNSGQLLSAGSARYTADALNNQAGGVLQSQNATAIQAATLTNDGTMILATQVGPVVGSVLNIGSLTNNEIMQSAGHVQLQADTLRNNDRLLFDSATLNVTDTSMADGAKLQTNKSLNWTGRSLSFDGSASVVRGASSGSGNTDIRLSGSFTNNATVYSGNTLTFKAVSIDNTSMGAIAARGDASLQATAGDFNNDGALFRTPRVITS
jgi:filamentous hemagglutinin